MAIAWLLVVPLFLVARAHPRLATVLIAAVAQFIVAHVYIVRIDAVGWGDGLESFAYLEAAAMACVFVFAAMVGVYVWQRRAARSVDRVGPAGDWTSAG